MAYNPFKKFRDQRSRQTVTSGASADVAAGAETIIVNKTSGSATQINLPVASTVVEGTVLTIKDGKGDASGSNITVATPGAETIDGSNTYVLDANRESVTLQFDGTNWVIIAAYLGG